MIVRWVFKCLKIKKQSYVHRSCFCSCKKGLCGGFYGGYLAVFGLTPDDFPGLVQKAKAASSMKGNPLELTDEQLTWILEKSL
ncbi:MAG: hypothetical protein ACK5HT_12120 [Draconibacterium sp.]